MRSSKKQKGNAKNVQKWLLSESFDIRKYYQIEELFNIFLNDTKSNDITQKSFKIHINKCVHT